MIVRLYRYGPTRHRLRKAWVVCARAMSPVLDAIERVTLPEGLTLLVPQRRGGGAHAVPVWLDTGRQHVHDEEARSRLFGQLALATRLLADAVSGAGGLLLPTAVDLAGTSALAADVHGVDVEDDDAAAFVANRLRLDVAALIGASGRAMVRPGGIDAGGSARLTRTEPGAPSVFLASASRDHLRRVDAAYRRDGQTGYADADVAVEHPEAGWTASVTLRVLDGQALLGDCRAWLVLLQALSLRARRIAREGGSPPDAPAAGLVEDRNAAAVRGTQAVVGGGEGGERVPRARGGVPRMLFHLLEDLRLEMRILGATFDEVAPVWSGAALRLSGRRGLVTENELFRLWMRERPAELARALPTLAGTGGTPWGASLGEANEKREGAAVGVLREGWDTGPGRVSPSADSLLVRRLLSWPPGEPRARALVEWQDECNAFDLGPILRTLPREERERVLAALRPSKVFPVRGPTGWAGLAEPLAVAARRHACLLHLVAGPEKGPALDAHARELGATLPEGFALLRLRRAADGRGPAEQELLLVSESP